MKILITGFPKFQNFNMNPTEEIIKKLEFKSENIKLRKLLIPVSFNKSFDSLKGEIRSFSPDILIMLGLAGYTNQILLERVAINCMDSKNEDNDGFIPKNQKISNEGDVGYFSTLPIFDIKKWAEKEGLPIAISNSAGTYVCNYIFYKAMAEIEKNQMGVRAGFIHVPPTKEIKGESEWTVDKLTHIISLMVTKIL